MWSLSEVDRRRVHGAGQPEQSESRGLRTRRALAVVATAVACLLGVGQPAAWAEPSATSPGRTASTPAFSPPRGDSPVNPEASLITVNDSPQLLQDPTNPDDLVVLDRVDRPDYSASVQYSTNGGQTWHIGALRLPPASAYPATTATESMKAMSSGAMSATGMSMPSSGTTASGTTDKSSTRATTVPKATAGSSATAMSMPGMAMTPTTASHAGAMAMTPTTASHAGAMAMTPTTASHAGAMAMTATTASHAGAMAMTGMAETNAPVRHKLYAPVGIFTRTGTLRVMFETLSGPGNRPDSLWIESSTNLGRSFGAPSHVAGALAFQASLAVDARTGELFATWLQANDTAADCLLCFATTGLPIEVSHSVNGGRSWSVPVQVSDPSIPRVGAPVIAVGPHGNPAVMYYDYGNDTLDWGNLPGTYHGTFSLVLTRSTNGGVTFGPGQVAAAGIVPTHRFLVYLPETPAFAIGSSGTMVAAWPDDRYGSPVIALARSTDHGVAWSAPMTVGGGPEAGVSRDLPAVSVAPDGRIDTIFYQTEPGTQTANVELASSSDGGAVFSAPIRLSVAPFSLLIGPKESPYLNRADFGGRVGLVSDNSGALAAWTDTANATVNTGAQEVYFTDASLRTSSSLSPGLLAFASTGMFLGLLGWVLILVVRFRARRDARAGPEPADLDSAGSGTAGAVAASGASVGRRRFLPPLRDPRWGQLACLTSFTALGAAVLHFPISMAQLALVLATCVITEEALALKSRRQLIFPASALITGLSLGLLLRSASDGIFVVAGVVAILSKQVIQARGKHIFNPSDLGLVAVLLLFGHAATLSPGQWGTAWILLFFIANAGLFVIFSVRRFHVVLSLYLAYAAAEALRLALSGSFSSYEQAVVNASVLLFAFFMVTDPRTSPSTRSGRILYAAGVGLLGVALQAAGLGAGLFYALAIACMLVPWIDARAERVLGRRVVPFTWEGVTSPRLAAAGPSVASVEPPVGRLVASLVSSARWAGLTSAPVAAPAPARVPASAPARVPAPTQAPAPAPVAAPAPAPVAASALLGAQLSTPSGPGALAEPTAAQPITAQPAAPTFRTIVDLEHVMVTGPDEQRCGIEVAVRSAHEVASGRAHGDAGVSGSWLAALATLDALRQLPGYAEPGELEAACVVRLGERKVALVNLVPVDALHSSPVGSAIVGRAGEHHAVARAVLDALSKVATPAASAAQSSTQSAPEPPVWATNGHAPLTTKPEVIAPAGDQRA
jgi:Na+-translocating ferredoxin:NAD+ oxidoreductase RnfD subunit